MSGVSLLPRGTICLKEGFTEYQGLGHLRCWPELGSSHSSSHSFLLIGVASVLRHGDCNHAFISQPMCGFPALCASLVLNFLIIPDSF